MVIVLLIFMSGYGTISRALEYEASPIVRSCSGAEFPKCVPLRVRERFSGRLMCGEVFIEVAHDDKRIIIVD
jgi:ligand-binding sensor protein